MRLAFLLTSFLFSSIIQLFAQVSATPDVKRLEAKTKRAALLDQSLTSKLPIKSVGPSIYSCRVTDLDVNPSDPTEFYVAYASGGLWHTTNNGQSFLPIFDYEASMTIGDIAVNWATREIWVGTGEANSSRSSYAGTGVYKTSDHGKTWQHLGLGETHHIGRVVLHPTDPKKAWVGALGHLYSPNKERGVFTTTDGGLTWQHTLSVNDTTGIIDLVIDPKDPDVLYAATWQRTRTAWHFEGAGAGSGIYKSIDAGLTWQLTSRAGSGFPMGAKIGRIGLAAGLRGDTTVLYASIDNQNAKPSEDKVVEEGLTKDSLRTMTEARFLALPSKDKEAFLKKYDFPEKYSVAVVDSLIKNDTSINVQSLVEYLEDANSNLFDTDFIGAEVYMSTNGGKTWNKTHTDPIKQMHFTYGYYFSNIRCDPTDANRVYLLGYLVIASTDGGKTWVSANQANVHVDHHALWTNPLRKGHLLNGNDGGLNLSYDNGKTWSKLNSPPVGQLYTIHADQADPFNIYAGNQDNGVWVGSSSYEASTEWHQTGKYPYQEIMGGDGMQVQVDTRDNRTVYTGYQFGNYFRIDRFSGQTKSISPTHQLGERPLRFNWQTPIHLSVHNQDILYMGANKVYRTMDKGSTWTAISDDLTKGGRKGNVPFGTISTLHESKLHFGLIYAGTDDGKVWCTKDGGYVWEEISAGLPADLWVTRIEASAHKKERVVVSMNGYRNDHFGSYVFISHDYGAHWVHIGSDLPDEPVNVVKEDPLKEHILYVGTDHQLYASLNTGTSFFVLADSFPHVAVHDLDFHEASSTLLIGTHGRSAYLADLSMLHRLKKAELDSSLVVLHLGKLRYSKSWGKKFPWQESKVPKLPVTLYQKEGGTLVYRILYESGLELISGNFKTKRGLNYLDILPVLPPEIRNKFEKALNKSLDKNQKAMTLEVADDGKIYLPKAKYKLLIGNEKEREFEIE
jgi:photosystem II stability/assembly factor-like uncharacterized protein